MANPPKVQRTVSFDPDIDAWIEGRRIRHRVTFAQEVRALVWDAADALAGTESEIAEIRKNLAVAPAEPEGT